MLSSLLLFTKEIKHYILVFLQSRGLFQMGVLHHLLVWIARTKMLTIGLCITYRIFYAVFETFETFDEPHLAAFDSNALKLDFEKTACTSANARKHIQSYYQMQLWIQASFRDASLLLNAESYGFERIDGDVVPEIVVINPDSLPDPCKCRKYA